VEVEVVQFTTLIVKFLRQAELVEVVVALCITVAHVTLVRRLEMDEVVARH
jgi:hypothetical protein